MQMKRNASYDLAWWEIPSWISAAPRIVCSIFVAFIVIESVITFVGTQGPASGIVSLIAICLLVFAGFAGYGMRSPPMRLTRSWWHPLFKGEAIIFGFVGGIAGFVTGVGIGLVNNIVEAVANWLRTGPVHLTAWPGFHVAAAFVNSSLTGFRVRAGLSLSASVGAGLVFGFAAWLFAGLGTTIIDDAGGDKASPLSPVHSQCHGLKDEVM